MFEAWVQAFGQLFTPANVVFLGIGALVGVLLGVLPGIGSLLGVSLALSLIWGMDPGGALLMLVGIHAAVMTGGAVPAILMRIPGSGSNIATMADGYPMTEKGEGARALGAALAGSGLGGMISVVFALAMIPVIIPLVLAMKSPELTLLMLVGLSFLATAGGGSKLKNLMAGMFGILVALIGIHDMTGVPRYTFGTAYLLSGLPLLLIALGVFAMAEIMDMSLQARAAISTAGVAKVKLRDTFEGVKDVFRNWWLWLRCSAIGYVIGVIPGIGGPIATFVAYGYGNRVTKHPEQYGQGCVEGVIAAESANNSSVGGSVLTTLAFGIPGDSVMALVLGAFLMLGIVPGKVMLTDNLTLVFLIIMGVAAANLLSMVFMLPTASYLAKITTVPYKFLFCTILVLVTASVYTSSREIMDIWVLIPLGIIGLGMKRFGFSLACFILGFVLGPLFEYYFWLSLAIYGPFFFVASPICIVFVVLLASLFAFSPLKRLVLGRIRRR